VKLLVAMDAFKGTLSAPEACAVVARGLRSVLSGAYVMEKPMADGGEGTGATIHAAVGGRWVGVPVTGPLPDRVVDAAYLWIPGDDPEALVEMARASGLELLEPDELDPLRTTTRGTGELVAAAARRGARSIHLTLGGSATVDGGTGAARALGWRFLDASGGAVPEGGGGLERIHRIEPPVPDPLAEVRVEVLCDVDNPLLGSHGAARVFAPQKGATPETVERLEEGLAHLAERIEEQLGIDVRETQGAGAAGGLGAGAVAFFGARLVPGVEAVMDAVGLDAALENADWIVTGEGRLDEQSLHGKVVSGVARRARKAGVRVAAVAGRVELGEQEARAAGIEVVEAAAPSALSDEEAMARPEELLEEAARRLAERLGSASR